MKKRIFVLSFLFLNLAFATEPISINFKSKIGDRVVEYNLNQEKTKPDQLQYFLKKSRNILKLKSHELKFCENEKLELSLSEGKNKKTVVACVRSKTKLTKEMKSLANVLQVQYAKP